MLANRNMLILNVTGLIVSLVACFALSRQFYYFLAFILIFCHLFLMSYDGRNNRRLLGSSFLVALILSLTFLGATLWTSNHFKPDLFFFLVYCFHYTYNHSANRWDMSYTLLFEAAWNGILVLLVGLFFALAGCALIFFASFLFSSMGSPILFNLISTNKIFQFFLVFLLYFLGMGIAQNNIKTLYELRFFLLTNMYYFLPILVLTSAVVLILVWNTNLSPNDFIRIFFNLIGLSILFLNVYYQDGDDEKKQVVWLNWLLRGYKVLLLIMILIANYYAFRYMAIELNQLINLLIALFLGGLYAYSAFLWDEKAQKIIENTNKYLAMLFIAAVFLAILSPFDFTVNKDKAPLSLWYGAPSINKDGVQKP